MVIQINPSGIEDDYLRCLNLCFGRWGDRRAFDWYFRRATSKPAPDLMIIKKEDRLAAGSGMTYRNVILPNGQEIGVGIVTGSWTLPEFRGQGCLTELVKESVRLTARKSGGLLLAFMAEDNPSFRVLVKLGAALFCTSYLFSTRENRPYRTRTQLKTVAKSDAVISAIFELLNQSNRSSCRFVYRSERDFELQFINRPGPTEIFSDDQGNFGIIESREDTDVLQLLVTASEDESAIAEFLSAFMNRALERQRKLFVFSSKSSLTQAGRAVGLSRRKGYLTALVANASRLRSAIGVSEDLELKDSSLLAQPGHPWFLGDWSIAGGDRA